MRAGIYPRVSTSPQSSYGTSLETQEASCRAAAEEAGYIVAEGHIWRETYSGRTLDRPQLSKMIEAVRRRELDALWIYQWDRLSRNPIQLIQIMKNLAECGVQIHCVRGDSRPGAIGELLTFVEGWAGEREAESFIERSKRNKFFLAQAGIFAHGDCRGVYGYDYISEAKERTVNKPESEIVLEIFDRVEAGESLHRIAVDLNERCVPTKRGGTWSGVTIENILRRTSYFGLDFYGRTQVRNGVRTPAPPGEWVQIRGFSPAVMSQERHEEANDAYDARTKRLRVPEPYLLTGFITCSLCGGSVAGRSNPSKRYYRCGRTASSKLRRKQCDAQHISKEFIDSFVWEEVCHAIRDPRTVMGILPPAYPIGADEFDSEIASLRKRQAAVAKNQENFMHSSLTDTIAEPELRASLTDFKRDWDELGEELKAMEDQRTRLKNWAAQAQVFSEHCRAVSDHLDGTLSFADRRGVLRDFGVTITTDGKTIEVGLSLDPKTTGVRIGVLGN